MYSSWVTILNIWLCGVLGGMGLAHAARGNKWGWFAFALMVIECGLYIYGWTLRG